MSTKNLVAVLVAFAIIVGAYVGLTVTDHPTGDLFALVSPFLAALGIAGVVNTRNSELVRKTDEQSVVIGQIAEQTNGILDARIAKVVRAEVRGAVGLPVHPE